MARLVVVSNRVPIPAQAARAGGLSTVLQDTLGDIGLWFGWSGRRVSTCSGDLHTETHKGTLYATVDLSEDDYQNYYVGFSNGALWPLLHFRLGLIEFRREHYDGYRAVNGLFADLLARLLRPDDLVWVHDYHLIPLATALRNLGVKNRIGFFLHVPFVPPTVFSALPKGDELLKEFLSYDVIGFQTLQHQFEFHDTTRELLNCEFRSGKLRLLNRTISSIVAPVGINRDEFERQAQRASRGKNNRRLVDSLNGRALIIGVDRLDYSKGLTNRFEAFDRLLFRFPQHMQRVSYLQIAVPSREEVSEYASLRHVLSRMAGEINGRHGSFDWVPLRYMSQRVARSSLAGFYRISRVGLVTPLRDGMNLVAHEFVAAQEHDDPGVLVLSRFAGAASYLDSALLVNPYDPDEIAEAMNTAISMSLAERQDRHFALLSGLRKLGAKSYHDTFIGALAGEMKVVSS